ncbi:MAG TPA: UxaA family hydrolase [Acidimicrobiales bacterium]|nr:UxaA family hydrolase [Acidimicrobiales bacterium]
MTGSPAFLAHRSGDDVAVAVGDVEAGAVTVVYLDSGDHEDKVAVEAIPLGHKLALRDLEKGTPVTEYGETIGVMYEAVPAGGLVHVHNLRSARWVPPR